MSQDAAAPRLRLNDDVWAHAISFLGDAKSLRALETTSRAHLTMSKGSTAWSAALATASTTALASAFLKAAPAATAPDAARTLCRAWAQRWRATDCSDAIDDGGADPRLCVRDRGGPVLRRPHVVFAIAGLGDDDAGVMNWDSRLSDGTEDDDTSLVLNLGERGKVYSRTEIMGGAIGTSCFVVEPDGTKMIELWRDVTSFDHFSTFAGSHLTVSHGAIELSRFGSPNDPSVLNYMSMNVGPPKGVQLMTLMGYVRFREVHFPNVVLGPRVDLQAVISDDLFQIVDAEASIGVCEHDTQFEFDDLALMLATALRNHPDAVEHTNKLVPSLSCWRDDALFAL